MNAPINSADQLIYRAAMLLEEEGDVDGAIGVLNEAIALSETARYDLQLLRARTVLGELFVALGRTDEARRECEQVIAIGARYTGARELIDEEVARAEELLAATEDAGA